MHLRMFGEWRESLSVSLIIPQFFYIYIQFFCLCCLLELAKDALTARGYLVIAGYMSPVNDAYGKKVKLLLIDTFCVFMIPRVLILNFLYLISNFCI